MDCVRDLCARAGTSLARPFSQQRTTHATYLYPRCFVLSFFHHSQLSPLPSPPKMASHAFRNVVFDDDDEMNDPDYAPSESGISTDTSMVSDGTVSMAAPSEYPRSMHSSSTVPEIYPHDSISNQRFGPGYAESDSDVARDDSKDPELLSFHASGE